jgi:hypothetical protein
MERTKNNGSFDFALLPLYGIFDNSYYIDLFSENLLKFLFCLHKQLFQMLNNLLLLAIGQCA